MISVWWENCHLSLQFLKSFRIVWFLILIFILDLSNYFLLIFFFLKGNTVYIKEKVLSWLWCYGECRSAMTTTDWWSKFVLSGEWYEQEKVILMNCKSYITNVGCVRIELVKYEGKVTQQLKRSGFDKQLCWQMLSENILTGIFEDCERKPNW